MKQYSSQDQEAVDADVGDHKRDLENDGTEPMNKPTEQQLKQALAKMLQEQVYIIEPESDSADYGNGPQYKWRNTNNSEHPEDWFDVTDAELLHICWLIEQELVEIDISRYMQTLTLVTGPSWNYWSAWGHASWQQRTIALAKVKGIPLGQ